MTTAHLLLAAWLLVFSFGFWLRTLNLRHLKRHGSTIPAGFEEAIDQETLARTSAYTVEQSRLGLAESVVDAALLGVFLFGGLLPCYDRWIASLSDSFILQGLLFFLLLYGVQTLVGIPFRLYATFRLEARYGFNTTTPQLWCTDLIKSILISLILMGALLAGALALVQGAPHWWWLWVWLFFALVSIFLLYLSPYVIEPLFNTFEPVSEEGLEAEITALMGKAGLTVSKVQQVDASKRSRHANAYFTGIGRVKRIVLYDTLISRMSHREILAVLAHEIGHWKLGHIRRRLLLTELAALMVSFLAWWLISSGRLPPLFGLPPAPATSFMTQTLFLSFLGTLVGFPLTPLSNWLSRRHEWQADRYAVQLCGDPGALASALVKLSTENLSNVHPHPFYAFWHYSHPPVVQRVARLREAESGSEFRAVRLGAGLLICLLASAVLSLFPQQSLATEVPVADGPVIVVGGDRDYPPYEFIDRDGRPTGFNVDLTNAIARVMGMQVEFRLGGWKEMRDALQSGRVDILQGISFSDQRAKSVDFSPPHSIVSHAIFARRDTPPIRSLDDLKGKEVIVFQSGIMHDLLEQRGGDKTTGAHRHPGRCPPAPGLGKA